MYELYPEALGPDVIRAKFLHIIPHFEVTDSDGNLCLTIDVAVFSASVPNKKLVGACGTPIYIYDDQTSSGHGLVRFLMNSTNEGEWNEIYFTSLPEEIRQTTLIWFSTFSTLQRCWTNDFEP